MKHIHYILIAVTGLALAASQATADPTLTISDGTNSISIDAMTNALTVNSGAYSGSSSSVYSGAGDSQAAFVGAIGNWNLSVDTGSTFGGPTSPTLDVNLGGGHSAVGGNLTVTWSDDTLNLLGGTAVYLHLNSDFQAATLSLASNGTAVAGGSLSIAAGSSAGATVHLPTGGAVTKLSTTVVLTGNGAGISTDGRASVPDSGTTGLLIGLGIGAIGLGLVAKKRRLATN